MNRQRIKSLIILGAWSFYVIFSMIFYPQFIDKIAVSGFLVGITLYLLTNPTYLMLMFYIIKGDTRSKFKATIASILIIFAFDMVASPRVMIEELLATGSSTIINMGGITMRAMMGLGFPATLAWYMYYMVLPIIFFGCALELLGIIDFVKNMKKGAI